MLTPQETQELAEARKVRELKGLEGWNQVLQPLLQQKFQNSWLDPRECLSDEDLKYKYSIAWAHAQAAKELMLLVDSFVAKAEFLEKKESGETGKNFRIGS
jgi:hypothetical protein